MRCGLCSESYSFITLSMYCFYAIQLFSLSYQSNEDNITCSIDNRKISKCLNEESNQLYKLTSKDIISISS